MADPGISIDTWFQIVVGSFLAACGAMLKILYSRDDELRKAIEALDTASKERASKEMSAIWEEISKLRDLFASELTTMRNGMDQDRKESWQLRTKLAADMITRGELREQLDRIAALVSDQTKSPGRHPPGV